MIRYKLPKFYFVLLALFLLLYYKVFQFTIIYNKKTIDLTIFRVNIVNIEL